MKTALSVVCLAFLIHALPSIAAVPTNLVVYEGNEWAQPAQFVNLSWDEINARCPAPTGLCTGTLNGLDITGFTWASDSEVVTFLSGRFGVPPPHFTYTNSAWAPAVFTRFSSTFDDEFLRALQGWTSTTDLPSPEQAIINFVIVFDALGNAPDVSAVLSVVKSESRINLGAWFYRPVSTAVPTMSIHGLIIAVLGLFMVAVSRLSSR